jgi:fumarate hydratase class II
MDAAIAALFRLLISREATVGKTRVERDSMGEMAVPEEALYGASTARAVENFPVSGQRFPRPFIRALGLVKRACAEVNREQGYLDAKLAEGIAAAAQEVADGKLDEHFPLDVYQTGSGTSTNMNANEVIANRAAEILGFERGAKKVHPNDHVNFGQSSNDVIPTAMHVAARCAIEEQLVPALRRLHEALSAKSKEFWDVVKTGRTHLQDATPVRLGQELAGYARQIELGIARAQRAGEALAELALGGTATGTGLNRHPDFPRLVIARLNAATGQVFREAADHFEAQGAQDGCVEASGALKTIAVSLAKIADDVRWLGSGPRAGLGEINLPELQPGSSIMPGKVNPVMSEVATMVAAQVIGNDAAVTAGGLWGKFELNVMLPVIIHNLLGSVALLASAARLFADRCVAGLTANREHCATVVERGLALCTALAPIIGYEAAAKIAKEAAKTGRTVREVARAHAVLPDDELDRVLDPAAMTSPGVPRAGGG